MKKTYSLIKVLFVLFAISTLNTSAQSFAYVGTGTSANASTGYPSPYGNWYWGAKHQMFITAAELTAAGMGGGVSISKLGFDISSLNGAPPHQGWTVKVYTTTATDPLVSGYLATTPVSTNTISTATGTVGWNDTQISPFIWTGSENLVIETCFNNSSYVYNYSTRWTTTLTGSAVKTRWNNQDNSVACSSPNFLNTSTNTRPNIRFEYIYLTPCSGTPGANSVTVPSIAICPNSSAGIGLANSYTVGSLTYQWQTSTVSAVGPFTNVVGANLSYYNTPTLNINTYYAVVITCTPTGSSYTATAAQVSISPVVINTVPYLENFEGIQANNKLPNCSWTANNIPSVTQTYINTMNQNRVARSGTKFAAFYMYYTSGSNYFYSNGIQMYAGITYSASLWYTTEYYGYTNTSELSLSYGASQSTTGLVTIASQSPAASPVYKSLSNTFTVPTSGIYYLAVKATGNGSYGTSYLSWDDLEVIIPCSLNASTVNLSVSSQTVCSGDVVNLNATGADIYLWSTGATGAVINVMPNSNTLYSVIGTSTLTGCSNTVVSQLVVVNPSPTVTAYATTPVTCAGGLTNLVANGANSYTWSTNATNPVIAVSPTTTTSYIVLGQNAFNCTRSATVTVVVNPLPVVTAAGPTQICKGESATLNGGGATTYAWASNAGFIQTTQAVVNPMVTTTYTLTGSNANGCSGKTTHVLTVNECVGINEITTTLSGVRIYPNPTSGIFTVEVKNALLKTIQVTDLTGRIIMTNTSNNEKINLNINTLSNGIYYVKIQTDDAIEVIKVVKQ